MKSIQSSSLTQSCLIFVTPWTAVCQTFLSITNSWRLLKLMSIESVMPSNHHILHHPFLLLPSIFPSFRVFSNESVLPIRWPKYIGALASASVSPMNIQDWFPLGWTGWISLQSKDSQESPPIPQLKNMNSSVFSLICGPTLTSIHDYWKNHSFD